MGLVIRLGVAVSSAVKWSQRYRATGSVAPGKMGGHRTAALAANNRFNNTLAKIVGKGLCHPMLAFVQPAS
ncbi:MAG: hypothetical protein E5Y73_33225 [Mesorhizobium sp.]|uniref:hypothetical protein n=1 Tax=Mesorhizobium sp. TaxID=1871066 RepID=UPI001202DAD0|nr:hypothetical protein [Mesorhizobium sp.]TIL84471.1 MAG: hypothetical protein E5Y73_33225 [Mesorhizobium sp.]TIR28102.1 MAG: hypothetical protein E5X35_32085 [Mesorhizobium sp.]